MKYHQVTVTMTNGFVYSYTCIGKMLESMKKSSQGYWTKTVESIEITPEEYQKLNEVIFEKEKVKPRSEAPEKKSGRTKVPKFADLEDFFDEQKPRKKK